MARAALNHGITKVVSEVLSSRYGNELYKIPAPASMIGRRFIEAFTDMKQTHQSIILAVQKGADGEVISNPPGDYPLENDDFLIVLAAEKPVTS
jgi:voltage-gated potassium channel